MNPLFSQNDSLLPSRQAYLVGGPSRSDKRRQADALGNDINQKAELSEDDSLKAISEQIAKVNELVFDPAQFRAEFGFSEGEVSTVADCMAKRTEIYDELTQRYASKLPEQAISSLQGLLERKPNREGDTQKEAVKLALDELRDIQKRAASEGGADEASTYALLSDSVKKFGLKREDLEKTSVFKKAQIDAQRNLNTVNRHLALVEKKISDLNDREEVNKERVGKIHRFFEHMTTPISTILGTAGGGWLGIKALTATATAATVLSGGALPVAIGVGAALGGTIVGLISWKEVSRRLVPRLQEYDAYKKELKQLTRHSFKTFKKGERIKNKRYPRAILLKRGSKVDGEKLEQDSWVPAMSLIEKGVVAQEVTIGDGKENLLEAQADAQNALADATAAYEQHQANIALQNEDILEKYQEAVDDVAAKKADYNEFSSHLFALEAMQKSGKTVLPEELAQAKENEKSAGKALQRAQEALSAMERVKRMIDLNEEFATKPVPKKLLNSLIDQGISPKLSEHLKEFNDKYDPQAEKAIQDIVRLDKKQLLKDLAEEQTRENARTMLLDLQWKRPTEERRLLREYDATGMKKAKTALPTLYNCMVLYAQLPPGVFKTETARAIWELTNQAAPDGQKQRFPDHREPPAPEARAEVPEPRFRAVRPVEAEDESSADEIDVLDVDSSDELEALGITDADIQLATFIQKAESGPEGLESIREQLIQAYIDWTGSRKGIERDLYADPLQQKKFSQIRRKGIEAGLLSPRIGRGEDAALRLYDPGDLSEIKKPKKAAALLSFLLFLGEHTRVVKIDADGPDVYTNYTFELKEGDDDGDGPDGPPDDDPEDDEALDSADESGEGRVLSAGDSDEFDVSASSGELEAIADESSEAEAISVESAEDREALKEFIEVAREAKDRYKEWVGKKDGINAHAKKRMLNRTDQIFQFKEAMARASALDEDQDNAIQSNQDLLKIDRSDDYLKRYFKKNEKQAMDTMDTIRLLFTVLSNEAETRIEKVGGVLSNPRNPNNYLLHYIPGEISEGAPSEPSEDEEEIEEESFSLDEESREEAVESEEEIKEAQRKLTMAVSKAKRRYNKWLNNGEGRILKSIKKNIVSEVRGNKIRNFINQLIDEGVLNEDDYGIISSRYISHVQKEGRVLFINKGRELEAMQEMEKLVRVFEFLRKRVTLQKKEGTWNILDPDNYEFKLKEEAGEESGESARAAA